jgi:hypothetical protein
MSQASHTQVFFNMQVISVISLFPVGPGDLVRGDSFLVISLPRFRLGEV